MAERPIPFKRPMVRAILDGRKTQTRRVLTGHCDASPYFVDGGKVTALDENEKPYRWPRTYATGDRLWVREAWRSLIGYDDRAPRDIPEGTPVRFEADDEMSSGWIWGRYRPGMFMPRWASRITHEVTKVRIQRLQDISEEDAIAEGAYVGKASGRYADDYATMAIEGRWFATARGWYADLWDRINGPGSWDENPWVATYTLKRVPQKEPRDG